ncbi:Netrin-4 [Bagarius yarrelli]|uniref:Netrin-4 n=1 Tax=Bagarius yarrelli TaxID=175774 RepID=A0A556V9F7_BAGYA|nr:Netrin-4 [Bagarius yarrelli]
MQRFRLRLWVAMLFLRFLHGVTDYLLSCTMYWHPFTRSVTDEEAPKLKHNSNNCLGGVYVVLETLHSCAGHACSPPFGNLANGRTLYTQSTCCSNSSLMTDDPFFNPNTWWESGAEAAGEDEIRLDLEDRFCLTHVVMVFRSPRPAAMSLERSTDFGRTWEMLKVFAENCSSAFGLPDDVSQQAALCTSRYSSAKPCSGGEAKGSTLLHNKHPDSDLSPDIPGSHLITPHTPILLLMPSSRSLHRGHACVMDMQSNAFLVEKRTACRATVRCEAGVFALTTQQVFTVRNVLRSTTTVPGEQLTAAAENRIPVRSVNVTVMRRAVTSPGESGTPRVAPAEACAMTAGTTPQAGGANAAVQDTDATRIEPSTRLKPAHVSCWCDPVGSVAVRTSGEVAWCHPRSGQCHCKPGVGGTSCNHCLSGHWGFGLEGCRPCACPLTCDPVTGHCLESKTKEGFYNVPLGGKIPDLTHFHPHEETKSWSNELSVSALYYTVIKASVLSAHDKGTHAVVLVKVRKVLRSGRVPLSQGTHSLYPLSWTSRGCTCPVLNPGVEYLLAGSEEAESGRLLVTVQSLVVPWTSTLSFLVSEALRQGCL